ncbi:unnamed protein product [Closterium sp. NIES-53]
MAALKPVFPQFTSPPRPDRLKESPNCRSIRLTTGRHTSSRHVFTRAMLLVLGEGERSPPRVAHLITRCAHQTDAVGPERRGGESERMEREGGRQGRGEREEGRMRSSGTISKLMSATRQLSWEAEAAEEAAAEEEGEGKIREKRRRVAEQRKR